MNFYKPHEIPKIHEVCNFIPHRNPLEFKQFIEDVKNDGAILNPVWVIVDDQGEHAIIDGRHRAEVAQMLGLDLPYEIKDRQLDQLSDFIFRNNIGFYLDSGRTDKGAIAWALCKMMIAGGKDPGESLLKGYGYRSSQQAENSSLREISQSTFQKAAKITRTGYLTLAKLIDAGDFTVNKAYVIGESLDWDEDKIRRCLSDHWDELQENVTMALARFAGKQNLELKGKEWSENARLSHLRQELQSTTKLKDDAEHELKIAREQLQHARYERDILKNQTEEVAQERVRKLLKTHEEFQATAETNKNDYIEYENTQLKEELKKERDFKAQLQKQLSDMTEAQKFQGEDPEKTQLRQERDLERQRREAEADQVMELKLELEAWQKGEKTVEETADNTLCATCPYREWQELTTQSDLDVDTDTLV